MLEVYLTTNKDDTLLQFSQISRLSHIDLCFEVLPEVEVRSQVLLTRWPIYRTTISNDLLIEFVGEIRTDVL